MWAEILRSKRLWVAVSGVVMVFVQDRLPITEDQIQLIVLTLASWIVGDSLRATDPRKEVRRYR